MRGRRMAERNHSLTPRTADFARPSGHFASAARLVAISEFDAGFSRARWMATVRGCVSRRLEAPMCRSRHGPFAKSRTLNFKAARHAALGKCMIQCSSRLDVSIGPWFHIQHCHHAGSWVLPCLRDGKRAGRPMRASARKLISLARHGNAKNEATDAVHALRLIGYGLRGRASRKQGAR